LEAVIKEEASAVIGAGEDAVRVEEVKLEEVKEVVIVEEKKKE
jgi:hypothetical protein